MVNKKYKVIFVGGGTGGHVSPNLAVIEELKKISEKKDLKIDLLYIGRIRGIEKKLAKSSGIKYKGIFTGKLRRYFSLYNFSDAFLIVLGFIQSLFILIFNRPDVIFAKGGFVTVPLCLAAALLRIPFIIHESDSVVGLSNKILAPFAQKVFLGFPPDAYKTLPVQKTFFSGSPVRPEILGIKKNKREFLKKYGLDQNKKTIFVFGGSQGSARINELLDSILENIIDRYNLIHQTGKNEEDRFKKRLSSFEERRQKSYLVYGYIGEELKDFLNNADLIISRAGANSIAEIIAMKKPAILIPLSTAASDHQNANARFLQRNGIVKVLDENVIDSRMLLEEIIDILDDDKKREIMVKNMKSLFPENSSRIIADEILRLLS